MDKPHPTPPKYTKSQVKSQVSIKLTDIEMSTVMYCMLIIIIRNK